MTVEHTRNRIPEEPLHGGVGWLSYREDREMHKAVCAECGNECEVPFKPDQSRPVYCRECFSKRRNQRRRY